MSKKNLFATNEPKKKLSVKDASGTPLILTDLDEDIV
jgi:hypothetical protein